MTLQAGVTNAELADFADSPNRGYGRFSYLPGNTLVQAVTYIGAAQTASHGSGDAGTCGDFITRLTFVDSWGNIKSVDRSHPDFMVYTACLGMCGVILEVQPRFSPSTENQPTLSSSSTKPKTHTPIHSNQTKTGYCAISP